MAKLNPPPPPPAAKPVDMRPVLARMNMILIAPHDGKQPGESYLTRFARALKFKNEAELFRTAVSDRAEFVRRYTVAKPPSRAHQAQGELGRQMRQAQDDERAAEAADVCTEVIREFLEDELVHQILDASEAAGTLFPPGPRPGLSSERPCRPADAEAPTASDEVWSSIGQSLLVLAERRAQRMAALSTATRS